MRTYSHHNIFISLHSLFVKSGRFLQGMPERVGVPFDFVRIWGMHFKDGDVILRYKEQKYFLGVDSLLAHEFTSLLKFELIPVTPSLPTYLPMDYFVNLATMR